MFNYKSFLCTVAAILIVGINSAYSQSSRFFDQSAMSSSQLSTIAQDEQGYLWIGSNYGLMRFDGNKFKTWTHSDNNSNTIVDNRVLKVLTAKDRKVYIATANGLQSYDATTHMFTLIPIPDLDFNGYISDICESKNGEITCVVSGVGIYKLDKSHTKLVPTLPGIKQLSWLNGLNKLIDYIDGEYVFSGQQGEIAIAEKTGQIIERKLCNAPINELIKDKKNNIIIVSNSHVWRYSKGIFTELTYIGKDEPKYKSAYCTKNGTIYITTSGSGIKRVSQYSNSIVDCDKWNYANTNVAHSKLNAIYGDKAGNLWVGCTNKGLLMLQNESNRFKYASVEKITNGSEGYIQDIAYDNSGNLWCSIEDIGAFKITENGTIAAKLKTSLQINRLHMLANGAMLAGVNNNGIYTIDAQGNAITPIATIDGTYNVTALTTDAAGNIYAAIDGRGVVIIDATTHKTEWLQSLSSNLMINNWVPALCVDDKQRLWIGHYSGLSCYDLKKKQFIKLNNDGLRQSVCNDIIAEADDIIWIATSQGLVRYDAATNKMNKYVYDNGIYDNSFVGIVADNKGNIWATTRTGMSKFDVERLRFTAFYGGNGMDDNTYSCVATNANNNRISFAGQGGITAFQPSRIKATSIAATPVITDISVKGQPIEQIITENTKLIENDNTDQVKKISLAYSDNAITLMLSTLDFRNANNVSYQYKFTRSSAWLSTNVGENAISLTNLTAGDYTLQIRACENGVFSPIREITISVAEPWFWSTWAKTLYLLLILTICWQTYLAMKRKRDDQIKEAKLQFFINISHEIRSPLTLILSPLEALLKQEYDAKTTQRLQTIHRNATRILDLVNQLLDIRKIDKGKMEIRCTETNLVPFISEFTEMFKPKAEEKQIELSFEPKVDELLVWIDRNNFDKVLINLLSNAFKYTPKGGEIRIELVQTADNKASIRVVDSGVGIDEKKTEKIFERFYQDTERNADTAAGFGIGLNLCKLLVELHHGTIKAYNRTDTQGSCFEVCLPLGNNHLSRQEKTEGEDAPRKIIDEAVKDNGNTIKPQKSVRHRSNYRLVVVDDDKEIRDYLAEFFAAYYKVETFESGEDAWAHVLNAGADVVISDVNMPGMNGIQLLKNIKNNGNTNHIPVILLTANTDYANRKEGWEKGADAYLPKPFSGEELLAMTESLIENRITLKGRFSGAQSQEDKIDKIEVKSNDEVLMNKIVEMINQHIDDPNLNVELLGQEVGISRAHLHRKMKDMIGVSPSDFIRTIRLRKACELLKNTDNDVTQIAYSIGFTSQTHFSTAFKKFMGVSPSEYRTKQL